MIVPQIILTQAQQKKISNGNTVFLFDGTCNCIAVILGYTEQDGVHHADIEAAERRESERLAER